MPEYVDGFLIKAPKKKVEAYRKIARKAGKIWIEHGALDYRECVSEELKTGMGLPFNKLLGLKPGEVAIFSWITYKSKAHRNKINKAVMADPRLANICPADMPFDCNKDMSYGGFDTLVSMKKK
jgi:uncharacterized protein YbaA (DUF1428 family)